VPPPVTPDLLTLRTKYNVAYSAYRSCVEALSRASTTGRPPSQDLLDAEARALRELTEARGSLLAAMRKNQ